MEAVCPAPPATATSEMSPRWGCRSRFSARPFSSNRLSTRTRRMITPPSRTEVSAASRPGRPDPGCVASAAERAQLPVWLIFPENAEIFCVAPSLSPVPPPRMSLAFPAEMLLDLRLLTLLVVLFPRLVGMSILLSHSSLDDDASSVLDLLRGSGLHPHVQGSSSNPFALSGRNTPRFEGLDFLRRPLPALGRHTNAPFSTGHSRSMALFDPFVEDFFLSCAAFLRDLRSFPTRCSSARSACPARTPSCPPASGLA